MAEDRPTGGRDVLGALGTDGRLRDLGEHVPALGLARALGVARDEVKSSRLLATLFDSSRCRAARALVRGLVETVLEQLRSVSPACADRVQRVLAEEWSAVSTRRELFRVDLVVEICSPSGGLVLGIENKIGAGEQQRQLARYQASLAGGFAGRPTVAIFLTPDGRRPRTATAEASVPAVDLGYAKLAGIVEAASREERFGAREQRVLAEVADSIREDILGQNDESVREKVRALWRAHPEALKLATVHRPRLADIRAPFVALIKAKLGDGVEVYTYPTRGDLREIKVVLKRWVDLGVPLTFMVYADELGPPAVRVLVGEEAFKSAEGTLRAWAARAKGQGVDVDVAFSQIRDWGYWRRVFVEADYPPESFLTSAAFDARVAADSAGRVMRLMGRLRSSVEGTGAPRDLDAHSSK